MPQASDSRQSTTPLPTFMRAPTTNEAVQLPSPSDVVMTERLRSQSFRSVPPLRHCAAPTLVFGVYPVASTWTVCPSCRPVLGVTVMRGFGRGPVGSPSGGAGPKMGPALPSPVLAVEKPGSSGGAVVAVVAGAVVGGGVSAFLPAGFSPVGFDSAGSGAAASVVAAVEGGGAGLATASGAATTRTAAATAATAPNLAPSQRAVLPIVHPPPRQRRPPVNVPVARSDNNDSDVPRAEKVRGACRSLDLDISGKPPNTRCGRYTPPLVREPSRAFQQQFYDKHFVARAPSTGDLYTHPLFSSFYDRLAGLALDRGPGPGAASARVLEVGCGEGLLGAAFARVARERGVSLDYTGVDLSESGLAQARPHVEGTLLQGDAAEIVAGVPEKTYDVITIKNLLHHLDDPADLLRAVGRALAPGGRAA